jgi:hypothetical protein
LQEIEDLMRRFKWLSILIVLVLIAVGALLWIRGNASWQQDYRNDVSQGMVQLLQTNPYDQAAVVIIVIDGLRWEEGVGAEDEYLPHIWNDLRPMGTLLTNYHIASPTATTSSHTAMMTGRISTVPNDGHIRPVFPTFMEYYRDARTDYVQEAIQNITSPPAGIFRPDADSVNEVNNLIAEATEFAPEKTSLYLGKDLIYELDQSSNGRYPAEDIFLKDQMRDIEVTDYFRAKIPDVKPNMVVVNLGDVDEAGHEVQWHYYVDAIRWADRHVWDMWQALQAQSRYRGKTYFIITTDHGRHIPDRGGFAHHGCFCDGCQHSFMLLIGPGIKQDFVSDEPHHEYDLAPTIGAAIGFSTPGCTGEPMAEVFENPDSLPEQRTTPTMELVAEDKENVDDRDTVGILLDKVLSDTPETAWGNNINTAMLFLALASRINNHPETAAELAEKAPQYEIDDFTVTGFDSLITAYPMLELGRALQNMQAENNFNTIPWTLLANARQNRLIDFSDTKTADDATLDQIALLAPLVAAYGKENDGYYATNYAYKILLDRLALYEGHDKVYTPGLDYFIGDYMYREDDNVIFTEKEMTPGETQLLIWSIERTLAESNPAHVPSQYPLLRRQYRLLVAFCHIWQDSDAMIGGTGDMGEEVDFTAQGLSLAAIADFQPWRKSELDELGYSPIIYRTPIFDWPIRHLFYIVGQANALAGAWAANDRLKLFVEDDGTIRRDLLDSHPAILTSDPDYPIIATSLAYGFSRFESADYNMFDLESYPLVYQQ